MRQYQSSRDERVLPMYEFTCQFAMIAPPPPEMQQLLAAVHGNKEAMDAFARVVAGVTPPAEFVSEENIGGSWRSLARRAHAIYHLPRDSDGFPDRRGFIQYTKHEVSDVGA
jgi:hypothetical protein